MAANPSSGAAQSILSIGDGSSVDQDLLLTNGYSGASYTGFTFLSYTAGGVPDAAFVGSLPTTGQWHHIAGVRDASKKMMYLYVDGVEVGSHALTSATAGYGSSFGGYVGRRLAATQYL